MAADITVEILRDIRDGIRDLREDVGARIDALRIDFTERLDQTNERLERVEHGLNDLGKLRRQIAPEQPRHEQFHTHHVERLASDVGELKERAQRLEDRAGG